MANIIPIELTPVSSSNLAAVGFDGPRQRLAVQFKNGKVLYYADVPVALMEEFAQAESLGRFYGQRIRGKFRGQLVTGECPKCGAYGLVGETCADCGCAEYAPEPQREASNG